MFRWVHERAYVDALNVCRCVSIVHPQQKAWRQARAALSAQRSGAPPTPSRGGSFPRINTGHKKRLQLHGLRRQSAHDSADLRREPLCIDTQSQSSTIHILKAAFSIHRFMEGRAFCAWFKGGESTGGVLALHVIIIIIIIRGFLELPTLAGEVVVPLLIISLCSASQFKNGF